MNKIVFYFLFVFSAVACFDRNANCKIDPKSISDRNNSSIIDTYAEKEIVVECKCSDSIYRVEVLSKYIEDSNNRVSDSAMILNQKLFFFKHDECLGVLDLPFKLVRINLLGKELKISATVLYEIKCMVHASGEIIYSLYGAYAFDPKHEFFGLASSQGKWLWYFYGDRYEVYEAFGSQTPYLQQFGNELNSLENMVQVFPY